MKATHIATAAAALALLPGAAPAQPGNRDVRCLMLSNLFAKAAPVVQAKLTASQARLFYLGRVSAKLTPAQLQPAMVAEARTIDPAHAGPEMNTCFATVQTSATAVEIAGRKAQTLSVPTKPAR